MTGGGTEGFCSTAQQLGADAMLSPGHASERPGQKGTAMPARPGRPLRREAYAVSGRTGKKPMAAALSTRKGPEASLSDPDAVRVPVDSGGSCPARPVHSPHKPIKATLDSSVWCTFCGAYFGEVN